MRSAIVSTRPYRAGTRRVHDLLLHALRSFRLNQPEYEWTALATAFYATNARGWHSREGQFIDFNQLAGRLMRQDQPQGVCYGQHRIYTLTMLLRIDDQMRNLEHQPDWLPIPLEVPSMNIFAA